MASRQEIEALRKANKLIEKRALQELEKAWKLLPELNNYELTDRLTALVAGIIDKYGSAAASVAAEWYQRLTDTEPHIPDLYNPDVWDASTRWALSEFYKGADFTQTMPLIASSVVRHIRNHGRETVAYSVKQTKGVAYARVPSGGETCDFCLLLAGRGPVYGTELDAKYRVSDGRKYHDDCDCLAVPVKGHWEPDSDSLRGMRWRGQTIQGYDFDRLYAEEYYPYHAENDTINKVLQRKREIKAKLRQEERNKNTDTQNLLIEKLIRNGQSKELAVRQVRLKSKTGTERLEEHEIDFLERFEAIGHYVTWIPRAEYVQGTGRIPTNDFIWETNGDRVCDVKTMKLKYSVIKDRIKKAVIKARAQGVVKDVFIVDVKYPYIDEKVLKQLENYNQNVKDGKIRELWLFIDNKLIKIDLV